MSHDGLRTSLGAYLLGALQPAERQAVDAHLAGCARCRDELAAYASLPGLLSRLDVGEAAGATLLAPPTLLPSVLAAVERERSAIRRRTTLWRSVAASLAAAAALVAIVSVVGRPDAAPDRTLVAAAGSTAGGTVSLRSRPWGTELELTLRDLPPASEYVAYAVDGAGARTAVATWGPTPDGVARVPGAVRLVPAAVVRVVVQTPDGDPVVSLTG